MKKTHSHHSFKMERLKNPEFAKLYMETVLEESCKGQEILKELLEEETLALTQRDAGI